MKVKGYVTVQNQRKESDFFMQSDALSPNFSKMKPALNVSKKMPDNREVFVSKDGANLKPRKARERGGSTLSILSSVVASPASIISSDNDSSVEAEVVFKKKDDFLDFEIMEDPSIFLKKTRLQPSYSYRPDPNQRMRRKEDGKILSRSIVGKEKQFD